MEEGVELTIKMGIKHQLHHTESEHFHVTLDKESHHHHSPQEKKVKNE